MRENFNDTLLKRSKWWLEKDVFDALKDLKYITENGINAIKIFEQALNEVYPDLYDIQLEFVNIRKIRISGVIKFPTVTITNSTTMSHEIKDLYVKLPFINEGIFHMIGVYGNRGKITTAELECKYLHSHLPGSSFENNNYLTFCLGDSEINETMIMLNSCDPQNINKDLIKLLLFQIETYVAWESLEGGPHRKIQDIVDKGGAIKSLINVQSIPDKVIQSVRNLIHRKDAINLDIINNEGKIQIVDNERFELSVIDSALGYFTRNEQNDYLCFKDEYGNYYGNLRDAEVRRSINSSGHFYFQGKPVRYEIIDADEGRSYQGQKYLHPELKQIFKNRLEYGLNKQFIKDRIFA